MNEKIISKLRRSPNSHYCEGFFGQDSYVLRNRYIDESFFVQKMEGTIFFREIGTFISLYEQKKFSAQSVISAEIFLSERKIEKMISVKLVCISRNKFLALSVISAEVFL